MGMLKTMTTVKKTRAMIPRGKSQDIMMTVSLIATRPQMVATSMVKVRVFPTTVATMVQVNTRAAKVMKAITIRAF